MTGPLARWRASRGCLHHSLDGTSWVSGQLINTGVRKLLRCERCGRTWIR